MHYEAKMTKTHEAQQMGQYKPTSIDAAKAAADFRIVCDGVIVWRDGDKQRVTKRELAKLCAQHTWATDF